MTCGSETKDANKVVSVIFKWYGVGFTKNLGLVLVLGDIKNLGYSPKLG